MVALLCTLLLGWQSPELIDRTLAIVSGRTITLSDARTALALGLAEGASVDAALVQRLVDRELMLRETERYQPPEPPRQQIDDRMASITSRAGGEAGLAKVLAEGGYPVERLRAWVRDDLRIDTYLQQRFADERRADLIADWVSDLRRRARITIFEP
jgi:hypothetical protein